MSSLQKNTNYWGCNLADYLKKITKQQNSLNLTNLSFSAIYCSLLHSSLRDLRNLRENIHIRVLNLLAQMKRPILPQIPLIYADKPLK